MHADIPPWRNGPQQLWRWGNLGLTAHTNSRLHIHKKQPKKYSFCVLCFLFFSSTLTVYVRYVASEMENYLVLLFHLRVFIAFYRTAEAVLEGCSFGVKILHICGELGRDCLSKVWNRLVLAARSLLLTFEKLTFCSLFSLICFQTLILKFKLFTEVDDFVKTSSNICTSYRNL